MTDEVNTAAQNYAEPFIPAGPIEVQELPRVHPGDKVPASPEARMAHALEYIAAQLGDMNRKLDRIIEGISPPNRPRRP